MVFSSCGSSKSVTLSSTLMNGSSKSVSFKLSSSKSVSTLPNGSSKSASKSSTLTNGSSKSAPLSSSSSKSVLPSQWFQ